MRFGNFQGVKYYHSLIILNLHREYVYIKWKDVYDLNARFIKFFENMLFM